MSRFIQVAVAAASLCGLFATPASANKMMLHDKFSSIDTNNDGKLSRDEFRAHARQHFGKLDSNGDGYVTLSELNAADDHKGKGMSTSDLLRKFDSNGDSQLTQEEYLNGKMRLFDDWDTDKNGTLIEPEFDGGMRMK